MLQSTGQASAHGALRGGGGGGQPGGGEGRGEEGGGGPKKKKSKINFFFFFFLPPPLSLPAPSLYARLPQCLEYSKECILPIMFLTVYANTESNLVCCTGQLVTTCIFAINRTSTKHVPSIHFYICSIVIFDSR